MQPITASSLHNIPKPFTSFVWKQSKLGEPLINLLWLSSLKIITFSPQLVHFSFLQQRWSLSWFNESGLGHAWSQLRDSKSVQVNWTHETRLFWNPKLWRPEDVILAKSFWTQAIPNFNLTTICSRWLGSLLSPSSLDIPLIGGCRLKQPPS